MKMRDKLCQLSRAASDVAATHAVLIWLDTLPVELLIAAEGRRRAGMVGDVTSNLPRYRDEGDAGSTVELQIETDKALAQFYWEHPNVIWSGKDGVE